MRTVYFRSLSIAAMVVLTFAGSVAAQEKPSGLLNSLEVQQLVKRAEPGDNARLAVHFTALADRYAAEAKRHTSMAQSFVGNPSRNLGTGMSFTYALFGEGTDIYWARTRVLEQLGRVQQLLPPGVSPTLGPDASGVGWVYQYVLKDSTGRMAALGGLPLPLLPLHLLWINVVTDGLPALALVVDPAEDDVLQRPPRHPDEPMLGRAEWRFIITTGLLQATATLGVFVWALNARDLSEARNLAFSVLVFGELFRAFAARSTTRVFWEVGAFTNVRLLAVVVFSLLMQLGIHHMPAAQAVFEIGPLSAADCLLTLLVASGPVTAIEVAKLVRRRSLRRTAS